MVNGIGRCVLVCSAALASALLLSACAGMSACSAVGYIYGGPAVVEFDLALPDDATLAACFGDPCEPATVERADGRTWEVPQELPYFASDELIPGGERSLRVVVTEHDGAVADVIHEIPIHMEKSGVFGECPGPFSFKPVRLTAP